MQSKTEHGNSVLGAHPHTLPIGRPIRLTEDLGVSGSVRRTRAPPTRSLPILTHQDSRAFFAWRGQRTCLIGLSTRNSFILGASIQRNVTGFHGGAGSRTHAWAQ